MVAAVTSEQDAKRSRTVAWVVTLATIGLVFDGYDLVIFGTVVSIFLKDPTQIGEVTPVVAGTLGSYALIGVLVGALLAGSVGDIVGRRKVMLIAYAWFSIGMALTALTTTTTMFGLLRFLTGLGVGALVATTGALVAEFAPPARRTSATPSPTPACRWAACSPRLLAILLLGRDRLARHVLDRRPADRHPAAAGLLQNARVGLPGSSLAGKIDKARAVSERTGVPLPERWTAAPAKDVQAAERVGFAGLFSRSYWLPTVLMGFMSATGLVLVYSLNTWLPELMGRAGFNAKGSLAFLLVLNGGAIIGALVGSRFADRFGPKPVVAACFLIGAVSIALLTFSLPLAMLLLFVAIVGLGHQRHPDADLRIRGQLLPHRMSWRRRGVVRRVRSTRWGRRPAARRLPLAAGLAVNSIFYVLAGDRGRGIVL